jgi:hypothetical protein
MNYTPNQSLMKCTMLDMTSTEMKVWGVIIGKICNFPNTPRYPDICIESVRFNGGRYVNNAYKINKVLLAGGPVCLKGVFDEDIAFIKLTKTFPKLGGDIQKTVDRVGLGLDQTFCRKTTVRMRTTKKNSCQTSTAISTSWLLLRLNMSMSIHASAPWSLGRWQR